jgi:hypothetical protein
VETPRRHEYSGDNKLRCEWENVSERVVNKACVCDGQIVARREKSGDLFLGEDNFGRV